MRKKEAALSAFNRARECLEGNPHLAGYLVGMADAWYIVGTIDRATRDGMKQIAKEVGKGAGA